jgi:hypothetical protein
MKIGDIIKQTLIERRIISEDDTDRKTRSFNLDNPQEVLDAALANGCATQWGIKPNQLRPNVKVDRNYTISGDSGTIVVPKGTRAIQDGGNGDYFIGNKISEDPNNTYFWGFGTDGQSFRWVCNALRSVNQAGTRSITPSQQVALDNYLSTDESAYTKIGGPGKVAKDIRELTYTDGRSIWDKNTGVPAEGNYVYIQKALYNVVPNQLLGIKDNLDKKGWTIKEPLMDTPEYMSKRRMIDLFPDLSKFGLSPDLMIYPKDASKLSGVTMDRKIGGGEKLNKEVCKPAIQFLVKCMNSGGQSSGCNDSNRVNNEKYTAARCYVGTVQKPQFKGILGLGDELSLLYNNPNKLKFGIGNEVSQIQRNTKVNEGSLTFTIKNHLLENIRNKNTQL